MADLFENGYVDVGIFQPTSLRQWYHRRIQHDRAQRRPGREAPGKLLVNSNWDPRRGRRSRSSGRARRALAPEGRQALHRGVDGRLARWKLTDPEAYRYLAKSEKLGIKNIHVHKGPTIWLLDKDAFDVSDVDHAATDFPNLNFIVEHVGLPRIEDFCFMATQEPNVYAGLAVVIGGLMHARPRFFAKVMGELLFWVGEDKMTFGSDYAIWEPKWQVEGSSTGTIRMAPSTTTTPASASTGRRRSSGSTRRRCTASRSRPSCRYPAPTSRPSATTRCWSRVKGEVHA